MEHRTSSVERPTSRPARRRGGQGGGGYFCRNIVTNRINIGFFRCFCRNIGRNKPRRSRNKGVLSGLLDRKSTRLNSSHGYISYAVFCLKKKKKSPISSCNSTR